MYKETARFLHGFNLLLKKAQRSLAASGFNPR